MINNEALETIYASMVAGVLPAHQKDSEKSVLLVAQDILGVDTVHTLISRDPSGQTIYYFALPSKVLASTGDIHTPLAMALPAHPEHKGDGAYVLHLGPASVAVIKDGASFYCMTNAAEDINEHLLGLELQIFDVGAMLQQWRFNSPLGQTKQVVTRLSDLVTKVSALVLIGALAVIAVESAAIGYLKGSAEKSTAHQEQSLQKVVNEVAVSSPINEQLAKLQRVSSVVVRAGGWLEQYEATRTGEAYKAVLPEWVTKDYIDALGSGAIADHDRQANNIIVHKGEVNKK